MSMKHLMISANFSIQETLCLLGMLPANVYLALPDKDYRQHRIVVLFDFHAFSSCFIMTKDPNELGYAVATSQSLTW